MVFYIKTLVILQYYFSSVAKMVLHFLHHTQLRELESHATTGSLQTGPNDIMVQVL